MWMRDGEVGAVQLGLTMSIINQVILTSFSLFRDRREGDIVDGEDRCNGDEVRGW